LLREKGIEPRIVEYLKDPPTTEELARLLGLLGLEPKGLVRRRDWKKLELPDTDDRDELIALMVANPRVIERPIVVQGDAARLGRPTEAILELL